MDIANPGVRRTAASRTITVVSPQHSDKPPTDEPPPSLPTLLRKHRRPLLLLAAALLLVAAIAAFSLFSDDFGVLGWFRRDNLDAIKRWILDQGAAGPLVLVGIQIAQILLAPIPGQSAGLAGGYVFGWELGIVYTMIGQALGTLLVFVLARKLGRPFVMKFNSAGAIDDFERLFFPPDKARGRAYRSSKRATSAHGLMTFFFIMLLPALPDDLVCFVVGLGSIPIWKLCLVGVVGRFPGMLALCMVGDGFSESEGTTAALTIAGAFAVATLLFLWQRKRIEGWMLRFVQRQADEDSPDT